MEERFALHKDAMDVLLETSRTFFIPIDRLPANLKEAVTSSYLCMRAIDEIEDHPQLPAASKVKLLYSIQQMLQQSPSHDDEWTVLFDPYRSLLPEVTLRMGDWLRLSPVSVTSNICRTTATMAKGMADWVSKEWHIQTEADLDQYTFYVAGLVGLLLTDLWKWHDDITTDRQLAVAFGRGLQAVNILRNRDEDLARGVDFFPTGWGWAEMFSYARRNLALADRYTENIQPGPILDFCKIPISLAYGTLNALAAGETKLSRTAVMKAVREIIQEK
jgi:farnesyl-diphosphate farnesyltransferase